MNPKHLSFVALLVGGLLSPIVGFAATLSLTASSVTIAPGETVTVSVFVTSTDQAMNSAFGVVTFPTDKLEVVSLSKANSIATLWMQEPSFSNTDGTVSFEEVVLNPGFKGAEGRMLTIRFRGKSLGVAQLGFSAGSVLANDGKGTELLSGFSGTVITVRGTRPTVPSTEEEVVPNGSLVIQSPTHPDQARWYSNNSPQFSWSLADSALEVRTFLGKSAKLTFAMNTAGLASSQRIDKLSDGTYYFFVQMRTVAGWGQIVRRTVNIDTTSPENFTIAFPENESRGSAHSALRLSAVDTISGIDHYEVHIDTLASPLSISASEAVEYLLPILDPGVHHVTATAFDRAGNAAHAEAALTVVGIDPPKITTYPEQMLLEDLLTIRGTTYPNATVDIVVSKDGSPVMVESTRSNTLGDFTMIIAKHLWTGTFTFAARATNEEGARSAESKPYTVTIQTSFMKDAVTHALHYFFFALIILIGAFLLAALTIWSWFELQHLIRVLRKRSEEEKDCPSSATPPEGT